MLIVVNISRCYKTLSQFWHLHNFFFILLKGPFISSYTLSRLSQKNKTRFTNLVILLPVPIHLLFSALFGSPVGNVIFCYRAQKFICFPFFFQGGCQQLRNLVVSQRPCQLYQAPI